MTEINDEPIDIVEEISEETNQKTEISFRLMESSLSWGIALVIFGGLFLMDNFGFANLAKYNWWAGFLLVPGINMLSNAFIYYRESGSINRQVRRSSFWGIILIIVSFMFLFNLDFGLLFPVFMILLGIYLLVNRA